MIVWLAQAVTQWGVVVLFALSLMAYGLGGLMYREANRIHDKTKGLHHDAACVFSSIMRDEIRAMDSVVLTLEDLMRMAPEEWALSYELSRDKAATVRDELSRKVGLLERYLTGTLSIREMGQAVSQEEDPDAVRGH